MRALGRRPAGGAVPRAVAMAIAAYLSASAGGGAERAAAQAGSPAQPAPAQAAAADSAGAGARGAPGVRRPSFMLPDVVVQGEDLSRFTGGVRRLEVGIPGVMPQQRPVPVEPGPIAYVPSWETPYAVLGPRLEEGRPVRGLMRAAAASFGGGQLGCAWLPDVRGPLLLWSDLEGWDEQRPGVRRWSGRAGLIGAQPPLDPAQRLGLGLGTSGATWKSQRAASGARPVDGGRQHWAGAHGLWQRRARILGQPGVMALRGRIGQLRTSWDQPAGDVDRTGRWAVAELSYSAPSDGEGSRPVMAARAGLARLRSPEREAAARARGELRLGLMRALAWGRVSAGAALAGDEEDRLLAPWLAVVWGGGRGAPLVRIEAAPQVVYADEVLLGRETLMPGGADFPGHLVHRLETLGADGLDLDLADRPGAERAGAGARLPRAAVGDPLLRGQTAWPRVLGEVLLRAGDGYLRLTAAACKLERPLGWAAVDSIERAAGGTVGAGAHRLATLADRGVFGCQFESGWRLARDLALRARYAWTHDERRATSRALPFVPAHEGFIALSGDLGRLSWEGAAHLRDQAPAGAGRPRLDAFVNVTASAGWSFGASRVLVTIENLARDDIELRPGLGARERWIAVAWEQALSGGVP